MAAASWSSFLLSFFFPLLFPLLDSSPPLRTDVLPECRLIDQTSLPPRSDSQSCHSRFHRRGSHGTVTRNIRLYPREIFVLAAAPTDAGLLQSVELLGELIFERRQRHSGIWWHRPPPPPPPTPPTDAQSRHQGRPLPICLVSHPLRLPASCFHDLALPLSSAALSSFSSFPVLFSSTPLVSSIFICIACVLPVLQRVRKKYLGMKYRFDNVRDISRFFFYFGERDFIAW